MFKFSFFPLNWQLPPSAYGCHPRFLKETSDVICTPLETIFKSFQFGEVPKIWKDANVSSIYKRKGDESDSSNYRPVSLTCIPCRLSEKFVREIIMDHMNLNNLFNNSQFGFRGKRSCILQLLDVFDDWVRAYDEGYQIDTIYLDFKKAFNSVPHQRLLKKLKGYGFGGSLLKWIEDFLQRVVLNGEESGIPQGSVLGPFTLPLASRRVPISILLTGLKMTSTETGDVSIVLNIPVTSVSKPLRSKLSSLIHMPLG